MKKHVFSKKNTFLKRLTNAFLHTHHHDSADVLFRDGYHSGFCDGGDILLRRSVLKVGALTLSSIRVHVHRDVLLLRDAFLSQLVQHRDG